MKTNKQTFKTKQMVIIGLFAALSYVLMLIHFPIKYLGFLELEFSDIPAIVAGLAYGPLAGVMIELIKNAIKALTASDTAGIGELANFIVSAAYVIPTAILFRKLSGKYKLVLTFGAGILGMVIAGILINYFVTVPLYARLYGGMDVVTGAVAATIPAVKGLGTIVVLGITPFNIFKGFMITFVGYYTYKLFRREIQ